MKKPNLLLALLLQANAIQFLKNMNQREAHNTTFALYLTGAMATDDYDGTDNYQFGGTIVMFGFFKSFASDRKFG